MKELISLKEERIAFWEAILDEYLQQKDRYDAELHKKLLKSKDKEDEIKAKFESGVYFILHFLRKISRIILKNMDITSIRNRSQNLRIDQIIISIKYDSTFYVL